MRESLKGLEAVVISGIHFKEKWKFLCVSICLGGGTGGWQGQESMCTFPVPVSLINILRASLSLSGPSAFYCPLFGLLNLVCMAPTERRHPSDRDRVRPAWVYCVKFRLEIHGNELFESRNSGWGRSHDEIPDVASWVVPHSEGPRFPGPSCNFDDLIY